MNGGTTVKNRAPAEIQITAEQLVRTARDSVMEDESRLEKMKVSTRITDMEELKMHQAEKRREFEEKLRHTMVNVGAYLRYANWEESQMEFRRARSIYERALEGEHHQYSVWIKYAEFEMRNKFVNHARNILDRAVAILPRSNQIWYKYVYMEETLGQIEKARVVFERWMQWQPSEECWASFINFEVRHNQVEKARDIYERFCGCFPMAKYYIKYAKWEERNKNLTLARNIFERAIEELPEVESKKQHFFIEFARFEERCKEFDRAREIYKQSLDLLAEEDSRDLYQAFVAFERQHGDRDSIENVLISKKRAQYDKILADSPRDYDTWFEYIRLEQAHALAEAAAASDFEHDDTNVTNQHVASVVVNARERVRKLYSDAVAATPPTKKDKRLWKRYIYLWINWAIFEELQLEDTEATRNVYASCLRCIPHKSFSFAKIWVMAAHFEIRQRDLNRARKIFGQALGMCPNKNKIFRAYIQMELQLGNVDRCRTLYEKYLEYAPNNCLVWQKFAELESSVGETARARAIFDLAVSQPELDMPETLWKRYIDWEISKKKLDYVERLYERLIERTKHVKVWMSWGKFEASVHGNMDEARRIFERGSGYFKDQAEEGKEDRAALMDTWLEMETKYGDAASAERVRVKMPNKVKRRRKVANEDEEGGWEEYFDYIFPDEAQTTPGLKLLQLAQSWKRSGQGLSAQEEPASKKSRVEGDENEINLDDL